MNNFGEVGNILKTFLADEYYQLDLLILRIAPHSQQSTVKNLVGLGQVLRSCLASGWQSAKTPTFYLERALDQEPCGPDGGKKQHQAEALGHCANLFRDREAPQRATGSNKSMQSPVWMETSGNMLGPPLFHFITETSGFPCFQASNKVAGGNE